MPWIESSHQICIIQKHTATDSLQRSRSEEFGFLGNWSSSVSRHTGQGLGLGRACYFMDSSHQEHFGLSFRWGPELFEAHRFIFHKKADFFLLFIFHHRSFARLPGMLGSKTEARQQWRCWLCFNEAQSSQLTTSNRFATEDVSVFQQIFAVLPIMIVGKTCRMLGVVAATYSTINFRVCESGTDRCNCKRLAWTLTQ